MKAKLFISAIVLMLAVSAAVFAQTPQEIVRKMSSQLEKCEKEGYSMDIDTRIIIIGHIVTHIQRYGDKMRLDIHQDGKDATSWSDATTTWDYNYTENEVTITTKEASTSESGNSELSKFKNLDEGYKLTLKDETAEAWYIACRRKSSNKDKSGFKKTNLVISKADYLPLSISSKGGLLAGMEILNIKMDVNEKDVTFNADEFPGVKVVDNR